MSATRILLPLLAAAALATCSDGGAPPPVATRLIFLASPASSVPAGGELSVQVAAQDAAGHTVTTGTHPIALSLAGGTGSAVLNGTTNAPTVNGVASFTGLTVTGAATGYTLMATSSGLEGATSSAFEIAPAQAQKLAFVAQPVGASAGQSTSTIRVAIRDLYDNVVTTATNTVSLGITTGTGASGATLSGTTSAAAVSGIATFSGVSLAKAGTAYTLTASASPLTPATSAAFNIVAAAADRLSFLDQPSDMIAGTSFGLRVAAQDPYGNTVTSGSATLRLEITAGTGSNKAEIVGTTTLSSVNGIATFSSISIVRPADTYRLNAIAPGGSLSSVTSNAFKVAPPPDTFGESVTFYVADIGANRVTSFTDMAGSNWQTGPTVGGNVVEEPIHLALDASKRIYVTMSNIGKFARMDDVAGNGWTTFGPTGLVQQSTDQVKALAIDATGRIYVTIGPRVVRMNDMSGAGLVSYQGALNNTKGIKVDAQGRIYVVDNANNRIARMDDMTGAGFVTFGTQGTGVGQFNRPEGIALDAQGRIYITDNESNRIVRIDDMTGAGWVSFGTLGSGVGQFHQPHDIAIGPTGRIYIMDTTNGRLVRMNDMTGAGWFSFGLGAIQNASNSTCPVPTNCVFPGKYEFLAPKGLVVVPR